MNNYPDNENDQQDNEDFPVDPGHQQHLPHEAWHEVPERRRRRPLPEMSNDENENQDQDD